MEQCDTGLRLFAHDNATVEILERFAEFRIAYQPYHGYICLNICVLGVITNVINIVVLTKPRMRSSINVILTAIAVCDTGTMLSYLIYLLHFVILFRMCDRFGYSHGWMTWLIVHMLLSVVLHTSSLWLSVLLAVVRLWTLRRNRANGSASLRIDRTWKLCAFVYAVVSLASVPTLFSQNVVEATALFNDTCFREVADGVRYYTIGVTLICTLNRIKNRQKTRGKLIRCPDLGYLDKFVLQGMPNCSVYQVNLWINGILFKTVPCILIAYVSFALLCIIREANRRKRRLLNPANRLPASLRAADDSTPESSLMTGKFRKISQFFSQATVGPKSKLPATAKKTHHDRTTPMLLIILFVFLFAELPQGVIAVLSGLYSRDVQRYIYDNVGDVLDLLSLVNSSVNFFLYCTMSAKYRQTFWQSILPASLVDRLQQLSWNKQRRGEPPLGGRGIAEESDNGDETTVAFDRKTSQMVTRKLTTMSPY